MLKPLPLKRKKKASLILLALPLLTQPLPSPFGGGPHTLPSSSGSQWGPSQSRSWPGTSQTIHPSLPDGKGGCLCSHRELAWPRAGHHKQNTNVKLSLSPLLLLYSPYCGKTGFHIPYQLHLSGILSKSEKIGIQEKVFIWGFEKTSVL